MTRVEAVSPFAALALHGLAHVPLAGIASLFDPAYIAWSARTLPADAREPLASDGPGIAAEADRTDAALALQWLPRLHRELATFGRTAERDLAALDAADVDDANALRVLRAAAPNAIEWLRADLALAARPFAAWLASAPLDDACTAIVAALALAPAAARPPCVRVAWPLGSRGRGFADEVVVGAPAAWNALSAEVPAVVAIHEHAVVRGSGGYAEREWAALRSVARALDGTALHDAHARWLAGLDLGSLAAVIPAGLRARLDERPAARAAILVSP